MKIYCLGACLAINLFINRKGSMMSMKIRQFLAKNVNMRDIFMFLYFFCKTHGILLSCGALCIVRTFQADAINNAWIFRSTFSFVLHFSPVFVAFFFIHSTFNMRNLFFFVSFFFVFVRKNTRDNKNEWIGVFVVIVG